MLRLGDLRHALTKIMVSNVFFFSKWSNNRGTHDGRDQSSELSEADLVRTNNSLLTAFKLEG